MSLFIFLKNPLRYDLCFAGLISDQPQTSFWRVVHTRTEILRCVDYRPRTHTCTAATVSTSPKTKFCKKELRKNFFLLISGQKNCVVNCAGVDFFKF